MDFYTLRSRKRLLALLVAFAIVSIVYAARLFYLQVFPDSKISASQINQLMGEIPITAPRGEIYDRNKVLLVKDAASYRIYARPKDISDYEATAKILASALVLDYNKLLAGISNTDNNLVLIKTKVDNDIAKSIKEQIPKGITIEEDKKRYYTNGNFMSNVLGFTGIDHQGLFGVEAAFNDTLKGKDGLLVYEKDANGNKINSGVEIRREAKAGDNVVLSMDSVIQHYAETETQAALERTKAKKVITIVTDIKTGEVLAMVTKPDYDLNNPSVISEAYLTAIADEVNKTDSSGTQVRKSDDELRMAMWANPAVSFIYEPGSTFKLITTSAVLEEGTMNMETPLRCPGYYVIDGVRVQCYIYPGAHGTNPLHSAVAKSCNPSLAQMILALGRDKFYKYAYNFGMGDATGTKLSGEEKGIVPPNNQNLGDLDFSTKSFGQGISTTPIQLVMGLNAIANGGKLMKPMIAKEIISGDTGEVIKTYEPEVLRQVISKETATNVLSIMREMITTTPGLLRLAGDVQIAGKTGTAEKAGPGGYQKGKYVASFYGVAPYEDPKIAVYVLVDEPEGARFGGQVAAPPAIAILKKTVNYANYKYSDGGTTPAQIVPDFRGEDIDSVVEALKTLGMKYKIQGDSKGIVTVQSPVNVEYTKAGSVTVTLTVSATSAANGKIIMPDLNGLGVQRANEILTKLGLKVTIKGGGIVRSQAPEAGVVVDAGTEVEIVCEYAQ